MPNNKTLSVAILSGKGGVGKSNIALNLGYCLYKGNHPLLLMDCDLGLANLDVLLGIAPERNLQDLLDEDIPPKDIAVTLEPNGFDFLPAASGVPELVDMDDEMRALLFRRLIPLFGNYDYLFLDMGAGITPTVLSFAAMSRIRLIVITPEPTSLTDGYALIKVLHTQHDVSEFHVIVNMAESEAEAKQSFNRLSAACERFLDLSPIFLGAIRSDKAVVEAVRRQTPLMKQAPGSKAGQDIFALAQGLRRMRHDLLPSLADEDILRHFTATNTK
jgi:flagellar biosynthesis protein FlhG